MCGILVSYGLNQPFQQRLLNRLRKRGPDGTGFWSYGGVNVAHTRLAILGLDERGEQPLSNDTHVISYNGEIYNFLEINERLTACGIKLRGASDTETLLHSWSLWGERILSEMNGFWAFAVYDIKRGILSLVRDQLGIKPLYYWASPEGVCASSLLAPILETVSAARELDYEALSEYVRYQFTFGDKTFLKNIKKVLPGHIVEIDVKTGHATSRPYEDIFAQPDERTNINEAWIKETRELLRDCCIESTISDTSFTTFCSGGIDSSFITKATQPEVAYHCNYSDPECNETFYAKQVVQGTDTRLFVVNANEDFNLVDRLTSLIEDFDEPTIGSVILPLEDLLTQVKRRYKVILTGTGGDELFAGYVRYQLALGKCFQDSYKALFAQMQGLSSPAQRFELAHRKGSPSFYKFYEPKVERTFEDAYEACGDGRDELQRMLTFDRRYFLAGLLNIDDKMCGRHSLEARPSFLNQRFVRHLMGVNCNGFMADDTLKWVARQLATGILPESVIHRTDKMGFTTPVGTFINQSSHLIREQITNSPFRHLYDLRKMNLTASNKFSREVFGLLMVDLWLNRYAIKRQEAT